MAKSIRSKRMKRLRTIKRKTWVKEEQDKHLNASLTHLAKAHKETSSGTSLIGLRAALSGSKPKHTVVVEDSAAGAGGGAGAGAQAAGADEDMDLEREKKGLTDKEQVAAKRKRRQSKRRQFKLYR